MRFKQFNRRDVVIGLGAGAGIALVGAGVGAQAAVLRARREISDLEKNFPNDLDLFRRAVAEMAKSSAGATAWERNAERHAAHCGTNDPNEIHYTLRFLPWHRAFLWATERNLQHAIGSDALSLPYWHWPIAQKIPSSFTSGALNHPRATTQLLASDYQFQKAMDDARQYVGELRIVGNRALVRKLGFGGYPGVYFSSALEGAPHGSVHNRIGNDESRSVFEDMGNISWSPRDPIFFCHHGNLDRLWEIWRGADGSAQRKSEPWDDSAFADASFQFFDLKTGSNRVIRLAEIRDQTSLGYRYAPPGEMPDGSMAPVGVAGTPSSAVPVAPDPVTLGVPIAEGDATLSSEPVGASLGGSGKTQAILTIHGISLPADRGVTVAIYLSERGKPFAIKRARFAGLTALVRQPAATKVSVALDVTAALAATKIASGKVAVTLVPVGGAGDRPLTVEGFEIWIDPR